MRPTYPAHKIKKQEIAYAPATMVGSLIPRICR